MIKKRIFLCYLFCFITFISNFSLAQEGQKEKLLTFQYDSPYAVNKIIELRKNERPKNIILMVGDGMSLSIMYTAWVANRGHLNVENCEYTGLSKTYSADHLITDSGAGGTAFATGHKTKNGSVGVDENGKPHPSILDIAGRNRLSTGLIVTCNILDATPSDFVAKISDRHEWNNIALQYVSSDVDFVFGGGWKNFKLGIDGRDLTSELSDAGYKLPRSITELEKINEGKVFALIADDKLQVPKLRGDVLAKASVKALELLSQNKKGFFLMIEGSMIDGYAHENNLEFVMNEMFDFDRTIGEVLKWAAKDGETLVIVTADHETGGWTLLGGDIASGKVSGSFSTKDHSGVMVPVYSFGPQAEIFSGIFENTELFNKMICAYGFNN
ncbi:MAG: alkaline phosphatase [Ignavibacteriaceae bacterium]